MNDLYNRIITRTSIRNYTDQSIDDNDIHMILEAGMSGPSCANTRDWQFIVIADPIKLRGMANANGKYAKPLLNAPLAVLVCGDLTNAYKEAQEYWIIDCAIACQNMVLCAHSLGIGSVWLGTWPQMERVSNQAKLFDLPNHIIPHSVISFGYPAEEDNKIAKEKYDSSLVHYEKW